MKSGRKYVPTAAKYIFVILIAGYIVLLMLAASGSRKSFEEISAAVRQSIDGDALAEQDSLTFKKNFGLNSSDYTGVLYYASDSAVSAEEILLICVKDDGQIRQVTEALEERVEGRLGDFEAYAPEQVKMLENAGQIVRGRYVFFVVSPEAERYLAAFTDSL